MKEEKELRIGFREPLNDLDTEIQTYGCRANNPNICGSCYTESTCVFVREDEICKKPSSAWKKQYIKLSKEHKHA